MPKWKPAIHQRKQTLSGSERFLALPAMHCWRLRRPCRPHLPPNNAQQRSLEEHHPPRPGKPQTLPLTIAADTNSMKGKPRHHFSQRHLPDDDLNAEILPNTDV
jgi:hypothetical protein